MTARTDTEHLIEHYHKDAEYLKELVLLQLNEQICEWMDRENVTRADLARRLGTSRAFVTKLLNGMPNLTVETLVKVALAIGAEVDIRLQRPVTEQAAEHHDQDCTTPPVKTSRGRAS